MQTWHLHGSQEDDRLVRFHLELMHLAHFLWSLTFDQHARASLRVSSRAAGSCTTATCRWEEASWQPSRGSRWIPPGCYRLPTPYVVHRASRLTHHRTYGSFGIVLLACLPRMGMSSCSQRRLRPDHVSCCVKKVVHFLRALRSTQSETLTH